MKKKDRTGIFTHSICLEVIIEESSGDGSQTHESHMFLQVE
jgi:hypothetical protein